MADMGLFTSGDRQESRPAIEPAGACAPARRAAAGFTLLELLVVASILLTLAAIALSYMWRARMQANEASAVATLRLIHSAEQVYSNTYDSGFSETLQQLGPPPDGVPSAETADLISSDLVSGQKSGYLFFYQPVGTIPGGPSKSQGKGAEKGKGPKKIKIVVYNITAEPIQAGGTGLHYYYVDETGIIRIESGKRASPDSPPV